MSKLDIAIAGEINLDLILYGLPEQMPTERELLASGFAITLGSSSAILAHNLAALDRKSGVWGKSVDLRGRRIIKKKMVPVDSCAAGHYLRHEALHEEARTSVV